MWAVETWLHGYLVVDRDGFRTGPKTLSHYLTKIAQLGGYLALASDLPPGNIVMWRGLSRPTDIELGFLLGAIVVRNYKDAQPLMSVERGQTGHDAYGK